MRQTLRLILWPSILTLVVNVLRLILEVRGTIGSASGGGMALLGITWLIFVFGAWFGWRIGRTGSRPALRWSPLWAVVPFLAMVGTVAVRFSAIDFSDQSEAAYASLRTTVMIVAGVGIAGALFGFVIWSRLALAMLLYGIIARGTVVGLTYLAKAQAWDTHYTKFGPAGIERELGETMRAACLAQLGVWVPFTVVGGMLAGLIAQRLTAADAR